MVTTAVAPLSNAIARPRSFAMVLGLHGETLRGRVDARTFRDRPTQQYAIHLETKVVVEMTGGVLLNDERMSLAADLLTTAGLGGLREVAHPLVFLERRGGGIPPRPRGGLRFGRHYKPALNRARRTPHTTDITDGPYLGSAHAASRRQEGRAGSSQRLTTSFNAPCRTCTLGGFSIGQDMSMSAY